MNAETVNAHPPAAAPTSSIGERLKRLRTKRGLTQTQLAIRANTTAMHIMDMENGYDSFEGRLTEIADALKCNPMWLETGLGGTAPVKPAANAKSTASTTDKETESQHNLSRLVVDLGHELENITDAARTRISGLVLQLLDNPKEKYTIAAKAQQAALRGAAPRSDALK